MENNCKKWFFEASQTFIFQRFFSRYRHLPPPPFVPLPVSFPSITFEKQVSVLARAAITVRPPTSFVSSNYDWKTGSKYYGFGTKSFRNLHFPKDFQSVPAFAATTVRPPTIFVSIIYSVQYVKAVFTEGVCFSFFLLSSSFVRSDGRQFVGFGKFPHISFTHLFCLVSPHISFTHPNLSFHLVRHIVFTHTFCLAGSAAPTATVPYYTRVEVLSYYSVRNPVRSRRRARHPW